MNIVLRDCTTFLLYAIIAIFAQNAVFSRGLGVSRLVQLVGDDEISSRLFGALLCVLQILVAPVAWFAAGLLRPLPYRAALRPVCYVACICVVCIAVALVLRYLRVPYRKKLMAILPLAGFNSCMLGTLLVTTTQNYTLPQSIGFGFGSGIGYILAVSLVTEAQRKLRNRAIPEAFRGLPITLLYIGVLALVIYGFTGHTVTI